eukprot:CAMPEP_0170169826 /NCGR_PEP_ID=MMETSP0040_2-20121228/2771_1 /TAXON_ID=641309 /ORGANISM="Lotharella oceanica, Strain CCMP622" /LENGTH=291 /DNA_ID=CAMNT_0010408811 /DNA_START=330 /DNA_END=1205 /DNA_ORIENTATION=+
MNSPSNSRMKNNGRKDDKTDENCQPLAVSVPVYASCDQAPLRKRFKHPNPSRSTIQSQMIQRARPVFSPMETSRPPSNRPEFKSVGFPLSPEMRIHGTQISKRFRGSLQSEPPKNFNCTAPNPMNNHEGSFTCPPTPSILKFGLTVDNRGSRIITNNHSRANARGIHGISTTRGPQFVVSTLQNHASRGAASTSNRFLASPLALRQGVQHRENLAVTPSERRQGSNAGLSSCWHQRYQASSRYGQRYHTSSRHGQGNPPVHRPRPCGDLHQYLKKEILGMRDKTERKNVLR